MNDKINNLYKKAREAKSAGKDEEAYNYFKEIKALDEESWEAKFEITYYEAITSSVHGIWSASVNVLNIEKLIFNAIHKYIPDEEKDEAVHDVFKGLTYIAEKFTKDSTHHFNSLRKVFKEDHVSEHVSSLSVAAEIMYLCGDSIIATFGERYYDYAVSSWKTAIRINSSYVKFVSNKREHFKTIKKYTEKIHKYDKEYEAPAISRNEHSNKNVSEKIKMFIKNLNSKHHK